MTLSERLGAGTTIRDVFFFKFAFIYNRRRQRLAKHPWKWLWLRVWPHFRVIFANARRLVFLYLFLADQSEATPVVF